MGKKNDDTIIASLFAYITLFILFLPFALIIYLVENHKESVEKAKLEAKELEIENTNNINDKRIYDIKNLLSTIEIEEFDYINYYDNKLFKSNYYEYTSLSKPKKNFKERLFYKKINYQKYYDARIKEYNENEKSRKEVYNYLYKEYESLIEAHNKVIINEKSNFLNYDKEEVEKILNEYIQNNIKDNICNSYFSIDYNSEIHSCIIHYKFQNYNFIPKDELVYLNKNLEIKSKKRKVKEIKELYEEYIDKVALKIIDTIFKFNEKYIDEVRFNGYVYTINQATGREEKMYILTVTVLREKYSKINLYAVNHKECLKNLGYKVEKNILTPRGLEIKNDIVDLRKSNSLIFDADFDINGIEFEKICKELLIANDFTNVEVTPASGDYGADVIAYKNDVKYAIQCKMYSTPVGVKAIQEVIGSKSMYNCHVGVVLTNNLFTPQAKKLAEINNILLWDKSKLEELLETYYKKYNFKLED